MEWYQVDFTRQPIIESIITPKEGCKLVVRSSKSSGQEEFFVDALEVVSFGNALFFRSVERPKAFIVPASDYEVLEVRETRMVLKNVASERNIKIGGGREAAKAAKEAVREISLEEKPAEAAIALEEVAVEAAAEPRTDKRRDKRRQSRRRRGREETGEIAPETPVTEVPGEAPLIEPITVSLEEKHAPDFAALLTPPPVLISETIARYKENALFKGAFYMKEGEPVQGIEGLADHDPLKPHPEDVMEALAMQNVSLESPIDTSFISIEEEGPFLPIEEKEPPAKKENEDDEEPPYRFS